MRVQAAKVEWIETEPLEEALRDWKTNPVDPAQSIMVAFDGKPTEMFIRLVLNDGIDGEPVQVVLFRYEHRATGLEYYYVTAEKAADGQWQLLQYYMISDEDPGHRALMQNP